jgi:hypothetical protein
MNVGRAARLALLLGVLGGCDEREPLNPKLARIRPAAPPSAEMPRAVTYELSPESELSFAFKRRGGGPTGTLGGVTGRVSLDLMQLSRTRGRIDADLMSLRAQASGDDAPDDPTATARAWVGLGSPSGAGSGRGRGTAHFELQGIGGPSAESAHLGKRARPKSRDTARDGDTAVEEVRVVTSTAKGDLTLHDRKAAIEWPIEARFEYPAPAISGVEPTRIVIETRRATPLPLSVFDILPRDATGAVSWAEASRVRKRLGRELWVSARLILVPTGGPGAAGWRAGSNH